MRGMRKMRAVYLIITLIAALFLSACTPHQSVAFWFGDNATVHREAVAVVGCETGGTWNPGAVSRTGDHGLFQINRYYHERAFTQVTGQPWSKVYDPFWNARYARWLYDQKSWQPWVCRSVL